MTTWCDLVDLGGARNNWEYIKVSYIEVALIGDHRRHDVALGGRNICDTGYLSLWRDPIQLAVVWSDGVQVHLIPATPSRYHTVPGLVRFEVGRIGMGDRISLHKRAQVSDQIRCAVRINPDHAIGHLRHLRHTMRAASAAEQDIKRVSDKSDIGCATNQTANSRTCLARGKIVHCCRDNAVGIYLRDTRASRATCVWPNRRNDLFAAAFS